MKFSKVSGTTMGNLVIMVIDNGKINKTSLGVSKTNLGKLMTRNLGKTKTRSHGRVTRTKSHGKTTRSPSLRIIALLLLKM